MIHILNAEAENYCQPAREILLTVGTLTEGNLDRQALLEQVPEAHVLIVRLANQVDAEVMEAAAKLKAIVTATTGLDHIDLHEAAQREIAVLSLKDETKFLRSIRATAEHTWALLLALIRHIPHAFEDVKAGNWDRDRFKGQELYGKRLGVLGLGRLGEKVARYGLAFGMQVAAYDPYRVDWEPDVIRLSSQSALMAHSDILSIHVPLNDETEGLVDATALSQLPAGAIVINTARGAVIDEPALVAALQEGHIGGAAVDVIATERQAAGHQSNPLIEYARHHHNCIVTPHIAGATFESMANTEIFMAKKLKRFLATR